MEGGLITVANGIILGISYGGGEEGEL